MQLHPADPASAMRYAVESIAAGFIGLDFRGEPGDLRNVTRESLAVGERDFWDFAHVMQPGDLVLVIIHHFPFALVTVSGDYNYISRPEPELGVWFRHFRRIEREKTQYFADRITNARQWDQYKMTDTISILRDETGQSYRLITEWSGK
jgi:hypothetical protein